MLQAFGIKCENNDGKITVHGGSLQYGSNLLLSLALITAPSFASGLITLAIGLRKSDASPDKTE